ncbi:hypothetical protein [Paraburkholderia sp. SOS3]|jgi:hypothetical protein|uniref:hypothetical protein n=1 Tax=Paraburkholderia sp. SOS3 TaxID=1926494 RepID=UPI0009475021|nr:hypothetical protein [Paraburkholderia sp. SOS3]APR35939.1 hypothetical protein BTO02_11475 [Paraburkholderia sp. SOS3]
MLDLDGKQFTLISNTAGDAKAGETIFTFEQNGQVIRATYHGGGVVLGAIIGQIEQEDRLKVLFQQVTAAGKLCGGEGHIEVQKGADGKFRFIDDWRFTINGNGSGQAVWQEL